MIFRSRAATKGPVLIARITLSIIGLVFLTTGGSLLITSFNSCTESFCALTVAGAVLMAIGVALILSGVVVVFYATVKARQQADDAPRYGEGQESQLDEQTMGGAKDEHNSGVFSVPTDAPPPYSASLSLPDATQYYGTQYSGPITPPQPTSTEQSSPTTQ